VVAVVVPAVIQLLVAQVVAQDTYRVLSPLPQAKHSMCMWVVVVPQVRATHQVVEEVVVDPRPSIAVLLPLRYHQVEVEVVVEETPLRTLVAQVAQVVAQPALMDRHHWQTVVAVVDRRSAERLVAVQTVERLGHH
jgi:hypothetical protein